ncbi:transposase, partial [Collinsella sp. AF23-4AC]|uniref:transposase n=1 Tax=Collinsella sp. AF23-4AC TaxID=2292224 RepID=UPI001F2AF0F1
MEELPSVRAEGALGAALGALADLWAAARDAALDMERAIEASLEENCPALLAMYGCGPVSAAKLAVAAGDNPGRLRSEASFAAICGACPIPASSGKTVRHRLNRGGDRQANSALHEIARQRVMRDPETAEYAERARARGKSDREVMRCLKRYVAREAYRALMHPHEIRRP